MSAAALSPSDFVFKPRRELSSGGFARVFAVKYRGEEVAVKVPQSQNLSDEIAILASIKHRNIVSFIGSVRYDDRLCIVLELAPKGSVGDVIKNGPLSLLHKWLLPWLCDIAAAIEYMHSDGISIVHGDLKGANVLVFDAPHEKAFVKVADFGQSRPLVDTTSVEHMGTHLWSAPEVLAEDGRSKRSDVWSFGCTAVEMVSEKVPYNQHHHDERKKVRQVLRKIEKGELTPLSDLDVEWPHRDLLELVQRCLEVEHKSRPTMEKVLSDMIAVGKPSPAPTPAPVGRAIYFYSWSPSGTSEALTLNLKEEKYFREALNSAKDLFRDVRPGADSVFFAHEGSHNRDGESRSYIRCHDPDDDDFFIVDAEDGKEVEPKSRTQIIKRFFKDESERLCPPCLAPSVIIYMYNDSELLEMSNGVMKSAPKEALQLERFIAFLYGVKCGKDNPRFFWRVTGNEDGDTFVSPEGSVVTGEKAIPGSQDRKFFWLFLQNNDELPKIPLPKDRHLVIYLRLGANVRVTEGRLLGSAAQFPSDLERWATSREVSDFDKKFGAAVTKK